MNIFYILLDAQNGQGGAGNGSSIIMIVLLFLVIWLMMIRPQRKKAKEEAQMREQLKKGDRVLFSGGIYGKVHSVGDTTVEVEVSNGVIMTVEKSFIQAISNPNDQTEEKK